MKGYGVIVRPLTDLLKKDGWTWTNGTTHAFQQLKLAMTIAPVLAMPDFSVEFVAETDAFRVGVGAVLSQKRRPIAYFSKALGPKHQTLSIYEKDMMAMLLAVKRWNAYLVGRHFKIKTDHQSLKFLIKQ